VEIVMHRLVALLLFSLPLAVLADTGKKDAPPNTLTPKEAAEGWLLLFDGATTFGWHVEGEAKVENGALVLGGEKATKAEVSTAFAFYAISLESTWEGKAAPTLRVGVTTGSAKGTKPKEFETWKNEFFIPGATTTPRPPVTVEIPAGTRVLLRSVKLKPSGLEQVFNAKDLTGWKKFTGNPKREKSKYTVTKEGWLNVKNGPGDLQTQGQYDDFILQLECISNGKHLNSGIFFRCLPGEYQQGYEAQIRNQFTEKPTQKYTIQDYDPKTNKLTGKRTVTSPAVDYGTGAIYRRVPARSAVAKDGEWFTMTVVARGRHLATWVNGVQQVDWTDNRPANENARNGYRGDKGAISIQGHDPTTDLSFRNIRLAPLSRPKE
jgi:hypothetical protein